MPPSRVILGIEVSNPSAWTPDCPTRPGVALARVADSPADRPTLLGAEPVDADRGHDADLMPAIDRLFSRLGLRPRDIAAVAVSVGPGGYTGVRIAVTTGKLIAEATGAECIPVPAANVAAHRATLDPAYPAAFAVALASKDESTFLTLFGPDRAPLGPGRLVTAANLHDALAHPRPGAAPIRLLIADRFLPAAIREQAAAIGVRIAPPEFDPAACIEAARTIAPVDPVQLVPIYPREPEAVTKWRALKAAGRK